jgi:predicted negative regulator of RcsB-dependent stress response
MALDIQEQESIAEFKAMLEKYGRPVLAALLAAVLVVAAVSGWRWYQNREAAEAAAMFDEYQKALADKDPKAARERAAGITSRHASSAYAALAALSQARANFDAGDATAAKAQLRWVIDSSGQKELVALARVRLAGVLLDEKAYDEALGLVQADPAAPFAAQYADRRGDILRAQGKVKEAREAYAKALGLAPAQDPMRPVIQAKLDALSGAS